MRAPHASLLRWLRVGATVSMLALAPVTLIAQQLRGTVRDSTSQTPIPGAVLVFLDSTGNAVGRNITNERGEYAAIVPRASRRLQVLRIGFRPRILSIPDLSGRTAPLDVVMTSIPTLLETISVVDQPKCSRRADRAPAFALWEQARTALLATVVARETNPANVVRLLYRRRLDNSDRILAQEVQLDSASTSNPFVAARSAEAFVEEGFAYDSAGAQYFNGPDAEVMLDDAFVRGYCFQLAEAERARPREIGLGFGPAQRKRGRVDIEGTVWIDSTSRALTDIVFRYVGLDVRAERVRPGGRISFRTMDNGTVVIDRWFLRFAAPVPGSPLRITSNGVITGNPSVEPRETGGELARAWWDDGHDWRASLGTVRGHVTGHGGPGTVLQLVGTDYQATVDSTGTYQISNLLPGPYVVGVADSTLADLGLLLETVSEFTAARDSTARLDIEAPSFNDYIAAKCEAAAGAPTNAVLVARVLMPDGTPAADAKVEVRLARDGALRRVVEGDTDSRGLFHMCNAPRPSSLQVRGDHAGALPGIAFVEITKRVATVKVQLKPLKP